MAKLNLILPDKNKAVDDQLESVLVGQQEIQTWSSAIVSVISLNASAAAQSTVSTTLIPTQLSYAITLKNPLIVLMLNLTLQGVGTIGVVINDLLQEEIPFNVTNSSINSISLPVELKVGSNKVVIYWKAITGTVQLGSYNKVYAVNLNS